MINKTHFLLSYLNHLLNVRSRFRIHSPFVYNFYKDILSDRTPMSEFDDIEKMRRDLLSRQRFIKRVDLGAKSLDFPFSQRFARVRDVARKSSVSSRKGELLFRIVRHYKPQTILEFGTAFGISTMYLAKGNPECRIYTMEGCPDTTSIASRIFTRLGIGNIEVSCGSFDELLPPLLRKAGSLDLVFFDGNHKQDATLRYFDQCLEHMTNDTIFVFDDIHWSKGMAMAWENIRQHPAVTLSIDLFSVGLVFFRKELSKEDFVLRF